MRIDEIKRKIMKPDERKDLLKQLFPDGLSPFLFKLLIEDAILVGMADMYDQLKKETKEKIR